MNDLFAGSLIRIKTELNEIVDIVIYAVNGHSKMRLFIVTNDSNLDISIILDNLKRYFKFESIIYIENKIKYYDVVFDQNIFLNYNCLITSDNEIINKNSFLKNTCINEFAEKYTPNDLIRIKPLINVIFINYKIISFTDFYDLVIYAKIVGRKKTKPHKFFIFFK